MKQADIFFPVKKVPVEEIMPGYEHPSGISHAIVVTKPDGTERVVQYCSDIYSLVPNDTIVPAFEAQLSKYYEIEKVIKMDRWSRFYVDFILKQNGVSIGTKDDKVFPKISLINSYDGSVKYNFIAGFFRLVCSNGLMIPEGDAKQIKLMHTPSINKATSFEAVMQLTHDFLEVAEDITETYHELQEQPAKDWLMRIEEVTENTSFPASLQEDVAARISTELTSVQGLEPTDWLVYNAFNYQLNHNLGITAKQSKKNDIDQEVLDYLFTY